MRVDECRNARQRRKVSSRLTETTGADTVIQSIDMCALWAIFALSCHRRLRNVGRMFGTDVVMHHSAVRTTTPVRSCP